MGLKVVHINRTELSKRAEAIAFWENVLKPKWEQRNQKEAEDFLAKLKGVKPETVRGTLSPKKRG